MNKKGQALVEFVLILPIFLLLIFAVYDFGVIFNAKSELENDSSDIIYLYKSGKSIDEISPLYPDLSITISEEDEYYKIKIINKVKLITPGFNRIFGNPYEISVERYVSHEQ